MLERPMMGKTGVRLLAASQAAIPYQTGTLVSMDSLAVAVVVMVLALAVLVGVLIYLRRRGWSGEWLAAKRTDRDRGIEVRASRRLGLATTVHVITYQGAGYLIVENGRGSSATVLRLDVPGDGTTEAP